MIPAWAAKYVGLPFKDHGRGDGGFDCWGLVKRVLESEFKLTVPDFGVLYQSGRDYTGLEVAFTEGKAGDWQPVVKPQEGDVVIFCTKGKPFHCGIVVTCGRMLHAQPVSGSVIDGYDRFRWSSRIDGFYRHLSRVAIECKGVARGSAPA